MAMRHTVLVKNPHVQSAAARVLLRRKLHDQQLADWLLFREAFFARVISLEGSLTCSYCGKENLDKDAPDGRHYQATIDHIVPISRGGARYDESNMAVACYKCNSDFSNNIKPKHIIEKVKERGNAQTDG